MEKKDIAKILSTIRIAYPSSFRNLTDIDTDIMMELWFRQFCDYDYAEVMAAVDSIIASDTSDFAPNVGKIKEMIQKIRRRANGSDMTELEAWHMVLKAIRKGDWYAKEEFEKFPKDIQKIVGSPRQIVEWGMMESEQVNSVVASNFQRAYRARVASTNEYESLPGNVKAIIKISLNDNQKLIEEE